MIKETKDPNAEKLRELLEKPVPMPERLKTAWLDGVSANDLDLMEYEQAGKARNAEILRLKRLIGTRK
jgi:hypothetical protein